MGKEHPAKPVTRGADGADHCAIKLLRLEGLFRRIAVSCALSCELTRDWPGLAMFRKRLFTEQRLELRLQPEFLNDHREFYELRFVEKGPALTGCRMKQDFGCGRLSADEVLSEPRVARCLEQKLRLLGLGQRRSHSLSE